MPRPRPCQRCGRRANLVSGHCDRCRRERPPMACRYQRPGATACGQPHHNYRAGLCDLHNYHDPAYRRKLEEMRRLVFSEESTCRRCGSAEAPTLEHIDGDMFNWARSNLARLCSACNTKAMHDRHSGGHDVRS